ncbi:MAG: glycosyltransferase family 9 protein [Luteibaculaceae bacterium]
MQRILIIQTAFIGDAILATALVESLAQAYPKANLDFLLRKGNETLLENNPHVNQILIWDKKSGKYRNLVKLAVQVRKANYDAVINLHRFATSGLLTWLSGAAIKIGFNKNPFSFCYTHKAEHKIGDGSHEVERNLALANTYFNLELQRPKVYPTNKDLESIAELKGKPYVCLAPASVWFTKQLPLSKWKEIAQKYTQTHQVYLLGAPQDFAVCEQILGSVQPLKNITNLCGKLSLKASAALMQHAGMCFVNDSAPLHLASAVDAPTTVFFCNTTPKFGFGPLSNNNRIVETTLELSCKPCGITGKKACPQGHFNCGETITVEHL